MNLPNQIKQKGSDGDFDTVVIEVRICRDKKTGAVWSVHDLQEPSDYGIVQSWPGWGIQALNSALTTEALRRSVYSFLLSYLSHTDPAFIQKYVLADPEQKITLENMVVSLIEETQTRSVKKMGLPVVKEILNMLATSDS